jgi:hypothetical protein
MECRAAGGRAQAPRTLIWFGFGFTKMSRRWRWKYVARHENLNLFYSIMLAGSWRGQRHSGCQHSQDKRGDW